MGVSTIPQPTQSVIDISNNIIYGGIIGSHSLSAEYNPQLKLIHVYGSITTNAALTAYSATNLFQITGDHLPRAGATAVMNNNQNKAHLVEVSSNGQYKYADSQAISGAVVMYIDHLVGAT